MKNPYLSDWLINWCEEHKPSSILGKIPVTFPSSTPYDTSVFEYCDAKEFQKKIKDTTIL